MNTNVEQDDDDDATKLIRPSRKFHTSSLSPREWILRASIFLLVFICLISDLFLYQHIVLKDWKLVRHLVDNGAHGSIAFCSWGIFLCKTSSTSIPSEFSLPIVHTGSNPHVSPNSWCEVTHAWYGFVRSCLITGIMASLLDVDHFIAAGALSLTKATHLHARPFGHTIAFIVFSTLVVWCYSLWIRDSRWTRIHRGCRVIIAFLSHQLRDGIRLGLWFWPFGSTPRVFYVLYIVLEIGLPIGLSFWQVTSLPSMGQARTFAHVQNDEEECHEV